MAPTYRDPIKGWTDNLYGPTGLIVGAAMGIVHCFSMDLDVPLDVVPVDYTANCMIAVAWNTTLGTPRLQILSRHDLKYFFAENSYSNKLIAERTDKHDKYG